MMVTGPEGGRWPGTPFTRSDLMTWLELLAGVGVLFAGLVGFLYLVRGALWVLDRWGTVLP